MALLDGLFGIAGKSANKFLGVDIGSSSIKVVQLSKKKGTVRLDTFGEISLGPYANKEIGKAVKLDAPQIAEAVKDLLKEAQTDAIDAGLAIPLKSSMVFNMKVPATDKSKLNQMVQLEARRYIPVPISEVLLDWSVIPNEDDDEQAAEKTQNILVVAVHKDTSAKYKEIAELAGLQLKFLEIETFATLRAVLEHDKTSVAILDIGASVSKLYLVEYGVIQKSHIIGVGSQNMLQSLNTQKRLSATGGSVADGQAQALQDQMQDTATAPMELNRILNEAKRIILDYQKQYHKNIEQVILTGGGTILQGVMPFVTNVLETEVTTAHPFAKTETPAFLEATLKDAGPEFAAAIGLALRGLR